MSRLILIRHGEPDEAVRGRSYGALDVPLSAVGREQAQRIARALKEVRIGAVVTSPLLRALETAAPLACAHGLDPVVHEGLRELSFGEVEGLSYVEIERERPELFASWMTDPTDTHFPGGESFADLRERVLSLATEIRTGHESSAVVAHGGVTRVILAAALGLPDEAIFRLDQPYGAISIVDWVEETPIVRAVNLCLDLAAWSARSS
jgi:broad specificity phosphatase PhoE